VNVLRRDQAELSSAFSGVAPAESRFGFGTWHSSAQGVLYLAEAQVNIFCRKVAAVPYGTHTIFIGEAEGVNVHDPIEPLIYQDAKYCFSVAGETTAQAAAGSQPRAFN
jgi:flavin reductase (DIM6/NTAB) family NADH-FMN oxidoreductase RutF